jgi:hypothetical protein
MGDTFVVKWELKQENRFDPTRDTSIKNWWQQYKWAANEEFKAFMVILQQILII